MTFDPSLTRLQPVLAQLTATSVQMFTVQTQRGLPPEHVTQTHAWVSCVCHVCVVKGVDPPRQPVARRPYICPLSSARGSMEVLPLIDHVWGRTTLSISACSALVCLFCPTVLINTATSLVVCPVSGQCQGANKAARCSPQHQGLLLSLSFS